MSEDDYESLPSHASPSIVFIAGSLAGIMEHCIIYPVDVIKTRMQCLNPDPKSKYKGIYDAFIKIVKNEGIFRPVRGMSVVAFGAGPAHALYFSSYEHIKKNFSGKLRPGDNSLTNAIAGGFSTLLHDSIMVPSDVIKQRLQMYNSPYRGIYDCINSMFKTEGIRSFYKSYFTQLSMNIPFHSTHLVTYDYVQMIMNPTREYNPITHSVSGAIAGALAAALTTPLDVCKTLINTQECCNQVILCPIKNVPIEKTIRANNLRDAVLIIYRTNGLKGFFKGILPRTVFQIPGTAVSWSVYEFFKYFLSIRNDFS